MAASAVVSSPAKSINKTLAFWEGSPSFCHVKVRQITFEESCNVRVQQKPLNIRVGGSSSSIYPARSLWPSSHWDCVHPPGNWSFHWRQRYPLNIRKSQCLRKGPSIAHPFGFWHNYVVALYHREFLSPLFQVVCSSLDFCWWLQFLSFVAPLPLLSFVGLCHPYFMLLFVAPFFL